MQKYSPEYLEAKRLKEKKRQHLFYVTKTKPKREQEKLLKNNKLI